MSIYTVTYRGKTLTDEQTVLAHCAMSAWLWMFHRHQEEMGAITVRPGRNAC